MSIRIDSQATNNADWSQQIQVNDADTDDLIDFTGANIEIEVKDQAGCLLLTASTGNGKVTLPSTGVIQWTFPVADMTGLCVGTYRVGGVYELNDETVSLFTGTLQVIDGIARL